MHWESQYRRSCAGAGIMQPGAVLFKGPEGCPDFKGCGRGLFKSFYPYQLRHSDCFNALCRLLKKSSGHDKTGAYAQVQPGVQACISEKGKTVHR